MIAIWRPGVRSIDAKVKPAHRDQWLKPIECVAISNGHIHLKAPNRYHKEWFEDHYLPSILQELAERTGTTFAVQFEVLDEAGVDALVPTTAPAIPEGRAEVATPPPRGLEP